jgi:hypothetical protein
MKLETLVKRFETCGYTPKGLSRDEECQSIIKWLFVEHNIFVTVLYMQLNFKMKPPTYMKFLGTYRYHCGEELIDMQYSSDNYFDSPYDAYYDALRHMLPAFKCQVRYGWTKKKINDKLETR